MSNCHEMKKGEIYVCGDCGLELEVVKECKDVGMLSEECACHSEGDSCMISCCGKALMKK